MTELQLHLDLPPDALGAAMDGKLAVLQKAATGAMREAAAIGLADGRAALAAGGFGARWQNTLRAQVYPLSGVSIHPSLLVWHKIPYASIFETGGTIRPSRAQYLWLPLRDTPKRIGTRRMNPALYEREIGPLTFARLGGKPFLIAAKASRRGAVTTPRGRPVFVGLASVTERRRFDITGRIQALAARFPALYAAHFVDD